MEPDAVAKQPIQGRNAVGVTCLVAYDAADIEHVEHMPEAASLDAGIADLPKASRRKPLYAVEQAGAGVAVLPGKAQGDLARVDIAPGTVAGEDRLVLGGKEDPLSRDGDGHRLDAEAVAGEPQCAPTRIEVGQRKHAVEQR